MSRFGFCLLLGLYASQALAFKLAPMNAVIDLDNKEQTKLFRITNDSDEKIAVQVTVAERAMDEQGNETHPDVEEFMVFPAQVILEPKQQRSIKVQWTGRPELEQEKAYRVIAEQMPITLAGKQKEKGNLKILLKYVAALYVSHAKFRPELVIEESKVLVSEANTKGKTEPKMQIAISNKGKQHQVLMDFHLEITQAGKQHILKEESALDGIMRENILAGKKRVFNLAWPKQLAVEQPFTVQLKFDTDK